MSSIKSSLIAVMAAFSFAVVRAQPTSPLITGNVNISITKGTLACDLVLSNLPDVKNYVIRLNSGLNVHYFKDLNFGGGALYYDMDTKDTVGSDETKAYYLHENRGNPARYIPEILEVKYLGMYPVVRDSASGYMGQDWRGNIAFNGYSIRADGIQGDWYPEIYDMDKKKLYSDVRYDIHITCDDCSVLFVNGSKPERTTSAEFKSDYPVEMAIYCGKFAASEHHGIWLLNSDMSETDERKLIGIATDYEAFYERKFGIPFKGNLTYVQTTPVAPFYAFSFYAAPTTFNVGLAPYDLKSLFDTNQAAKSKQTMAHELAHYYFGTLLKPRGVFGSILAEGFAEYLSYELTRNLEGENTYRKLLRQKISSLTYFSNYQPLAAIKTENDYGNREYYLYYYAPILFMAIRTEIGDEAMWKWLKTMVTSGAEVTDYQFLLATLKNSLTDQAMVEKIASKYFTSTDALKNAIQRIAGSGI